MVHSAAGEGLDAGLRDFASCQAHAHRQSTEGHQLGRYLRQASSINV